MFHFILKGGPVMIPIVAGSVIGLALVLERFWAFRTARVDTFSFVQEVFKLLKSRKSKEAISLCETMRHPLAIVFKIGIERRNLPLARLEKILEQAGNNQIQRLERNLGVVSSIVSIEPLMGFLGTITGLIRAFMSWEQAGANVTISALAAGIYEAMITTAAALTIAIPLFLCYNFFVSRIKLISNELSNHAIQLLEVLAEIKEERLP